MSIDLGIAPPCALGQDCPLLRDIFSKDNFSKSPMARKTFYKFSKDMLQKVSEPNLHLWLKGAEDGHFCWMEEYLDDTIGWVKF